MSDWLVYVFIKGLGVCEDLGHKLLLIQSNPTSYTNPDAYKEVVLQQLRTKEYTGRILAEYAFVLPAAEIDYADVMSDAVNLEGFDELDDALAEYRKVECPSCGRSLYEVGINVEYSVTLEFTPVEGDNEDLAYKTPDCVESIDTVSCGNCYHDLDVSACTSLFGLK